MDTDADCTKWFAHNGLRGIARRNIIVAIALHCDHFRVYRDFIGVRMVVRFLQGMALLAATAAFGQVNISGTVTDSSGAPLSGVAVKLTTTGTATTSGTDGKFTLSGGTGIASPDAFAPIAEISQGSLILSIPARSKVTITAFDLDGKEHGVVRRELETGSHGMALPRSGSGIRFWRIEAGDYSAVVNGLVVDGEAAGAKVNSPSARIALAKSTAAVLYDVITAGKTGYHTGYLTITNSEMTGVTIKLLKSTSPKFSFFVAGMRGLQELSKSQNGFGGDLRFGETGAGAGLRGADKICATLAEKSLPSSFHKGWRAFLSVSADANGKQVNAIDRVGAGPWYDRIGRMLAPTVNDLKGNRPMNGDAVIKDDLPNEYGVLNHNPDLSPGARTEDNHHMMTGSSATGTFRSIANTCKDWTTSDGTTAANNGKPGCGFAWPRCGPGCTGKDGTNWITSYDASGCAAGVDVYGSGGAPQGSTSVGAGGGYGGFYCFALNP